MIPAIGRFIEEYSVVGKVLGLIVGGVVALPIASLDSIDGSNVGPDSSVIIGSVLNFVGGFVSTDKAYRFKQRIQYRWKRFDQARHTYFSDDKCVWPEKKMVAFHKAATLYGIPVGTLVGYTCYFGFTTLMTLGMGLSGTSKKIYCRDRRYMTFTTSIMFPLVGALLGALCGYGTGKIMTSRMLWG